MNELFLQDADALAALVPDGASVAIAKPPLEPVALAAALIRRGARGLHLINVPTGAFSSDILIGAGAVRLVETSGVTLSEFGLAPRFVDAVKSGAVEIRDSTCPAVYAALQAGEKGQPFATLRGLIGSDIMAARPDYKVIDNPYRPGDPVAVLPPIRPDIALIHADLADSCGNVHVGGRHELKTLAHAAQASLITVEEVWDGDFRLDAARAPNLISPIYIRAIARAPKGAWPSAAPGRYDLDAAAMRDYAAAARDQAGFDEWLDARLLSAEAV